MSSTGSEIAGRRYGRQAAGQGCDRHGWRARLSATEMKGRDKKRGAVAPRGRDLSIRALRRNRQQDAVDRVRVDASLLQYVVALAGETRRHADLEVGLSPRGSLALAQSARATALLRGRDYAIPEDITSNWQAVAAHRVIPKSSSHGSAAAALG